MKKTSTFLILFMTFFLNTSTNTNKVDVTNLSKGIYLVTAYSGSEKSTKKIVLN